MPEPVLYEKRNSTAILTLNRPERRNAINRDLLVHLYNRLEEANADETVRAIFLTGNGPSFCSGIDLAIIATDNLFDPRGDGRDLPDIVAGLQKPLIGAVNGHAITGGLEMALNCDFLIASENAMFADTHAKVGVHPGWGMTQLLPRAVGARMARQMSFTGEFISASTALRCGLVNEVVPPDRLMPRALAIADAIAAKIPMILQYQRELIKRAENTALDEGYAEERASFRKFIGKFGLGR